jgi:hypothetical protein
MILTLKVSVEAEPGDELLSEAKVVQNLQNALAGAAGMPVDELVLMWRGALAITSGAAANRSRHVHGRKKE